ncbi:MAG: TauD/TfdA family dioxygenase [Pseudomonadota bacterium]|nr:TauD/TfdA family dioxygenase [Pseudomonadota bacterium]
MNITLHAGAGAEIRGVGLRSLDDDGFAKLRAAFAEHGLLFFRDQALAEADHIALAERFGPINVNRFFAAHPTRPQIAMVTKEPDQIANIGGGWHTDHSYDEEPALGSILIARELPPVGGETWFVSMYRAFDALSDGLKSTLMGLRAVHSAAHVSGTRSAYRRDTGTASGRIGNAKAADALCDPVHPVVIRHPLSGRAALYVNPGFTLRFEGWTEQESRPLLEYLYSVATREAHICRFDWAPGSVAFWDNRATWHFAQNNYAGHRREMHRITIEGCALEAA